MLLESLGLLRAFLADPGNAGYAWGLGTRNSLHVLLEALRLAFADRDMWIGDERFSNVPASSLLDPGYLADRRRLIAGEAVMCSPVAPGNRFAFSAAGVPVEGAADELATRLTSRSSTGGERRRDDVDACGRLGDATTVVVERG